MSFKVNNVIMSKDSSFQKCDAMSLGEWFPTFWWIMVSSSFRVLYLWKWSHHGTLEKLGATHPSTQRHIEEDFNPPW